MTRAWWVVLKKELNDSVRDRRSGMSLLLFPLVGPLLVSLMLSQVVERATSDRRISLPVAGAERAPGLVQFLEGQGISVIAAPADPERAVRDRTAELVLVIGEDYAAKFRAGRPAHVELVIDDARDDAHATVRRVRAALQGYSQTVGSLRLLARGVSAELPQAIAIDDVDLSTPQSRAAVFLNFVPMFVLLAAFVGGMQTASDATAGERERGSLEPLLLTPVTRRALVMGKWLASIAFAAAAVFTTLVCTILALSRVPLHRFGMTATLDLQHALLVLCAIVPVTFFTCGLQLFVASFARTVKESQTYMSLLVFVPMLPAILLSLDPMKIKLWMTVVPIFGQQALLMSVIRGEHVAPLGFVLAALSASSLGLFFALATAMLFRRERIVYGR